MKIIIDIPEDVYEEIKSNDWSDLALKGFCIAVRKGTVLPKGHNKLLDINAVKQKVFDITDLYDSGEYLVLEDGKYLIGNDIQNDNRRILSFNEALQGVINGMPAIIEADKEENK